MISQQFVEGSTGVITVAFTDTDGVAVTPNTLTYTLIRDGGIVNSREDVTLTPSSTVNIVLYGNDLLAGTTKIIIEGAYDSSIGSNLPIKKWDCFEVIAIPTIAS